MRKKRGVGSSCFTLQSERAREYEPSNIPSEWYGLQKMKAVRSEGAMGKEK